jgi:hypothetical protein
VRSPKKVREGENLYTFFPCNLHWENLVKGWHLERGPNSRKLISRTQGMFPGVQTHFPGPEGLSASTPIFESSAKPRVAAKAKASTGSTRATGSFEEEPGN